MNRQQRRAAEARAKMQKNAERVKAVVEERRGLQDQLDQMKQLLFAVARKAGRLRIDRTDIDALHEDDRVDFQVTDRGDVIIDYASGAA